MAGFIPRRTEGAHTTGETRDFTIANTTTLTLGDQVKLSSGFVALSTTDRPIGIVDGFVDANGLPLVAQHARAHGGTYSGTPGVYGSETLVSSGTNQTVELIKARVIIDPRMEYYNDANGSLTTANIGQYFSSTGSDTINASTASATVLVWILVDIDPDSDADASKGIFRIVQSVWNQ